MPDQFMAILTPVDDISAPHFRRLENEEIGGPEALVLALHLRRLAVLSRQNGLLCLADGSPMDLNMLMLTLGYSAQKLEHGLKLLIKHGLAWVGGAGIHSLDPLVAQHFANETRYLAKKKGLMLASPTESGGPVGRPPKGEVAMSSAERQAVCRRRKKEVTKASRKVTESFCDTFVTDNFEATDNVEENDSVTKSAKKEVKEFKKPTTPNPQAVVVDEIIFNNILMKYGREDLAELARTALLGRKDVVARVQFCDKVVTNQLDREAKASAAAATAVALAAAAIKKREKEDQIAQEYCRLQAGKLQAAGYL